MAQEMKPILIKATGQEFDDTGYQGMAVDFDGHPCIPTDIIHIHIGDVVMCVDVKMDGTVRVFTKGPYKLENFDDLKDFPFFKVVKEEK